MPAIARDHLELGDTLILDFRPLEPGSTHFWCFTAFVHPTFVALGHRSPRKQMHHVT